MSKLTVTQKHEMLVGIQKEREEKYNEYQQQKQEYVNYIDLTLL